MSNDTLTTETVKEQENMPYKNCLNCGAELKGHYCHNCGQEALAKTPTVLGLVLEYLSETFVWDSRFFSTLWTLIRRPGKLTNDYLAGKYISQESPLKLNMFLLLVFVTLFITFSGTEKVTDSVHNVTNDEKVFAGVQLNYLVNDSEYAARLEQSPRDTVLLHAPLLIATNYPKIITSVEIKEDTAGQGLDTWVAVVPRLLIEDRVIVADDEGCYSFNKEVTDAQSQIDLVNNLWAEMVRITSQYFPILLLLTAPFLSISLRLVQRKSRLARINHYIFALHYTAMLEFLMICIFVLHLTIAPPMRLLELILVVGSCTYLTIAFKTVYKANSWKKAIVKSLLTSLVYILILSFILIVVFFAACVVIIDNQALNI